MTTPSSPVGSIAKAMEGAELTQRECIFAAREARKANGADTYPARVLDKAAGVIADLARQAEAMKREMAEKDARIAALREALLSFEYACEQLAATRTHEIYTAMIDGGQTQELLELDNARRRARALIGGVNED
ncbi:hypothetical protein [Shinella sp.]|uniref:hypothetical protein n=1 Tax=Shinella sp. TaxID=1870904 RepID=UPI0028A71E7F|nr:hypothetical protein [Shinella sp.]